MLATLMYVGLDCDTCDMIKWTWSMCWTLDFIWTIDFEQPKDPCDTFGALGWCILVRRSFICLCLCSDDWPKWVFYFAPDESGGIMNQKIIKGREGATPRLETHWHWVIFLFKQLVVLGIMTHRYIYQMFPKALTVDLK